MTLDEALASARLTFPGFPTEVFKTWLDDRIKQNGWPPSGIEWEGFLLGRSVREWQSFIWQRERLSITFSDLSETANNTVRLLISAGALGQNNIMSAYIPNTKQRFASVLEYLKDQHCLPGTIVLLRSAGKFYIIEGNHRIAALLALPHLGSPFNTLTDAPVEAWVASETERQV